MDGQMWLLVWLPAAVWLLAARGARLGRPGMALILGLAACLRHWRRRRAGGRFVPD